MTITTIYVTRHGFRGNWTVNPQTGTYHTTVPSPTNIASDPPLAAYGAAQSHELATALLALPAPPITRIYSSPFYRCLQTLQPFVEKSGLSVRGDTGLGEWYGKARFTHPSPATPEVLARLFPAYEPGWKSSIVPSTDGEGLEELHDRCAYALAWIVGVEDERGRMAGGKEEEEAMLICTHAASMIAIGRALTGRMPDDVCEEDFRTFTCGISKFVRRAVPNEEEGNKLKEWERGMEVPKVQWRDGRGVAGGWDCVMNSDCTHLEGGEERGWHFQGDEGFGEDAITGAKL